MKAYRIKEQIHRQAAGAETIDALAHDLRTPMCCVAGAAQLALLASSQGKMVDEQLHQILTAVNAMDAMLETVCGRGSEAPCTAARLEQSVRSIMGMRAQRRQQLLSVNLNALEGAQLPEGDALERVVLNLVSNAVKYTPEGGSICVMGLMDGNSAEITVSDNGMGMKRDFMRRMFVPYQRAKESEHLPGKGLGLPIVRRLVQGMNGTIRVRSAWGKGTAVTVCIPVKENMRPIMQ